jgi:DNA replication protein DnaC
MLRTVSRAVVQAYEMRRLKAERERDARVREAYAAIPELRELDRAIAAAGADLLLETVDPSRPRLAAAALAGIKEKRRQLLAAAGLDADFDQIRSACPHCCDTGYIGERRCSCYRSVVIPLLAAQANLAALAGISFDTFDDGLFSDQTDPERYQSELSPRQQIQAIKKACLRFVREFDQPHTRNLLFFGNPGTGKTFLMACVAQALLGQGRSVLYMTAPQLFAALGEHRTLLSAFNPDDQRLEKAANLAESIMTCDLLLVDDLGTEAGAASRYADLLGVIDGRGLPGLRMIISSNSNPALLRELYDERLLSRLVGGFAVYRFFGEDVRLVKSRRRRNP